MDRKLNAWGDRPSNIDLHNLLDEAQEVDKSMPKGFQQAVTNLLLLRTLCFYYDKSVYSFTRLPMGYANSAYIAQSASELCYGQSTMLKFLKHKGWTQGSSQWPFYDISEILIVYLDDLCLTTDKKYNHQIHLNALEFILFATKIYGFKIGKNKFHPFVSSFKFLGHFFSVEKSTNSIPPDRLKAFKEFRSPASCAETLSRLGVLS